MSLDEEYPKVNRNLAARLRAVLQHDAELSAEEVADLALILNVMADRAAELDDVVRRLVDEEHSSAEIGELLIAFQLTNEQMRGASDMIEKKLFDIGDRIKAVAPTDSAKP